MEGLKEERLNSRKWKELNYENKQEKLTKNYKDNTKIKGKQNENKTKTKRKQKKQKHIHQAIFLIKNDT